MREDQNKNLYLLDEDETNQNDLAVAENPAESPEPVEGDEEIDEGEDNAIITDDKKNDFSFNLESEDEDFGNKNYNFENKEENAQDEEGVEGSESEMERINLDSDVENIADKKEPFYAKILETDKGTNANIIAGQAAIIKKILDKISEEIEQIKKILPGADVEISDRVSTSPDVDTNEEGGNKIVEGVFDGEGMVGSDGKHYDVPANYASKSKLVEGDILKLTISPDGSFLFKQIGPSERNRIVGTLAYDPVQGRYLVVSDNKKYYILTASVTYFKGKPGDEVVILVPRNNPSRWGAVENIISKKETAEN